MSEYVPLEDVESADGPVLEPIPPQESSPRVAFWQRARFRRATAGLILATTVAGAATQPSLRMDITRTVASATADMLYNDTLLGVADQGLDTYVEHAAGWDTPIETTIKTYYDPEHPTPRNLNVTNFVIPGFREMHDEEITGELVDATKHDCPTRYVAYGNQAVTPDSLAELIIKNLEENPLGTPEIGFTGHSMGGVLLLEALARVHEMGYKLPKVAFIDFLSTPAGMPTARFAGAADFFTETNIGQKATGELATDVLQQMDAQHFEPRWYAHDIPQAWDDVLHGASDALTASQLQDLAAVNGQQALYNLLWKLRDVISPETKVTYFAPVNPASDTVVDDPASFERFSKPFKDIFGITMRYVAWGDGHANFYFGRDSWAARKLTMSETPTWAVPPAPASGTAGPSPSNSTSPQYWIAAGPTTSSTPSPTP